MADDDGELVRELAVLAHWQRFPADRVPRPLVLTGRDRVRVPGFADVQHKEAHLAGAVVAYCDLPPAVLDAAHVNPLGQPVPALPEHPVGSR